MPSSLFVSHQGIVRHLRISHNILRRAFTSTFANSAFPDYIEVYVEPEQVTQPSCQNNFLIGELLSFVGDQSITHIPTEELRQQSYLRRVLGWDQDPDPLASVSRDDLS